MKPLIAILMLVAISGVSNAQSTPSKAYQKSVADASGGPAGINVTAPKQDLESQLKALQALLPEAPDQESRDSVNANICILQALLGKTEDALETAARINDKKTRDKRKLHITQISKGTDAVIAELKALLANDAIPENEHILYIEKVISTIRGDEKYNEELAALGLAALEKTKFKDNNSRVGMLVVKFCQAAAKKGVLDTEKFRTTIQAIVDNTPETPKTAELIEAVNSALGQH